MRLFSGSPQRSATALGAAILLGLAGLYFAVRPHAERKPAASTRRQAHFSREQYRAQLTAWAGGMRALQTPDEARRFDQQLPDEARVGLPSDERVVALDFAHRALNNLQQSNDKNREAMRRQLQRAADSMESMAADADERSLQPSAAPPTARDEARRILARREFRQVHGPGLLERLGDWLQRWLQQYASSLDAPAAGDWKQARLVGSWAIIVLVLLAAILWIRRAARNEEAQVARDPIPFARRVRHGWRWHDDEAQRLAESGLYAEAMYNVFWCAALWLEQEGAWRVDRTRTPREMLRLLPEGGSRRRSFAALLRAFELSWYAQRPTARADYEEARAELERLGRR